MSDVLLSKRRKRGAWHKWPNLRRDVSEAGMVEGMGVMGHAHRNRPRLYSGACLVNGGVACGERPDVACAAATCCVLGRVHSAQYAGVLSDALTVPAEPERRSWWQRLVRRKV